MLRRWGEETGRRLEAATRRLSILFFTRLFPAAFSRERFYYALLFAGLPIKGVTLALLNDIFLNDIFLLHQALEAAQRILKGLTLLESDFRQLTTPQNSSRWTR